MNDEQLYRGRFNHIGDRQLNSVRVFVSSTFSDTTDERNGLIERVYPKLREYCLTKYNIQFQYSDMRWGIQSTALNTHSTIDMCLQELDTCCRLSMATNCVVLLSHRYGSCLIPACISSHIFQLLEESLSSNIEEKNFLSQMYQLDENYLEKKYFLRTIDDQEQWNLLENKLQIILRKSAEICYKQEQITEDERNEFFISVTAKEIYRALKNNQNSSRRIICFFREIIDLEKLDAKYREIETEELLAKIKHLLHQSINASDIYTYQIQWHDENHREKYFSQFFEDFYQAIQSQIDFHMHTYENQQKNSLYNQIFEHAIQCNLLIQRYFSRQDILEQIKNYIISTSNSPCVLLGESGTGKSSIMAKIVSEIPTWYSQPNSVSVIIRFLGVTPSSSDIRRPLISIIEQICAIYQLDVPFNFDHVQETLENILMKIPRNEHLILLLDSIDQLDITDLKKLSIWLPRKFPSSNVKCIFSSIPDIEINRETIDIRQQLRTIYQDNILEIEVNPFDENLAEQVLDSWLKQDRRCLTDIQYEWLKPKLTSPHLITPLFLSLLYDQTLTWHSYDQIPDRAFLSIKQTRDAIGYLYHQLGLKHGQILFRRSMRYLQLSGGLSELEIEDILSLDDDVLQSVFLHYLPPFQLFRLPSTLWIRIRNDMHKYLVEKDIDHIPCIYFYHRSFQYYQPMDVKQLIIDNQEKEIMEKTRLEYFAQQYKSTFDMTYSPKLAKKYKLTTMIISVNRCLTEQKPLKQKKTNQYNLRRVHQLYMNINRYDFIHHLTIFNYEFLSAYLLCGEYRMSDLLYQFSIGAHDPNGELRFLLKQFEASASILNRYPNNLSLELIYRLYPFRNQLPELTDHLLEQCLIQCPLLLITDNQRQQYLEKYSIGDIIELTIDGSRLFVLTKNEKLYLFYYYYYGLLMTDEFDIVYKKKETNEKFISFLCQYPYVGCLSSNSSMIVMDCQNKQVSMQISCRKLISFINEEIILIISSGNNSVELWNCSKNSLISQYDFPDQLIEDCSFKNSIIKVTFQQSSMISYFSIDKNFQFNSLRILHENIDNHNHHLLLDIHTEFYYSLDRSQVSLIIFHDNNSQEILHNIDFHSLPKSVIYLPQSNSIAWLTSTSLMLFHPLYQQKLFQPFPIVSSIHYDYVHDHYSSLEFRDQTNFLACVNQANHIIDIYEWRYDDKQQKHIYRRLTRLQLEIFIDRFVFRANWFDGLTIFCSDGSNIYKYNATMITYLISSKSLISSEMINQIPSIHSDEFLTFHDNDHLLKIFTLNEANSLQLNLSIQSIVDYYFTKTSSHVLLINEKNILSIYSLKTAKLLWTTDEFENKKLQIHSLPSSFIFICLQTKQIFLIDTKSCELKNVMQLSNDCLLSTVTSNNRLYIISNDQKTLTEFNIINQNLTILPAVQFTSEKIIQLSSVSDSLVFHTDNHQIYLRWNDNEQITPLEKASHFISKDNRLVLVSIDQKILILYDLKEKLRGIIRLDNDAGQCEAMHLSENYKQSEQYLFVICYDRFLRIYSVSNGKQLAKLFIQKGLDPFIGILNNRLLLKVDNHLCIIKILDKESLSKRLPSIKCPLFEQSMWMTCHHDHCLWSNTVTS